MREYLRIITGGLAISLVVTGYLVIDTAQIATPTHEQLGNVVGASAAVPRNEYNILALELDERERTLAAREQELAERERGAIQSGSVVDARTAIIYTTTIGGLLLTLLIINFLLDMRRDRRAAAY